MATAKIDRMADALGWAVEIAQDVEGVTGSPLAVFTDAFGTMGGVAWIGVVPDAAAADAGAAKLRADAAYLGKMAATVDLFVPNSGYMSQAMKIA